MVAVKGTTCSSVLWPRGKHPPSMLLEELEHTTPPPSHTHRDMKAEDEILRERMGTTRNGRGIREGNGAKMTKASYMHV